MSHPIITQTPPEGKWSGKDPIPKIEDTIGVQFHNDTIPSTVIGYYTQEGWIGILTKLQSLPSNLERYGVSPKKDDIIKKRMQGVKDFYNLTFAFQVGIFGAEIHPAPENKPPHGPEEELAVLITAACYRNWREKLQEAWINGSYPMFKFDFLCGELQRIRNHGSWDFIDQTVEKNPEYIKQIRQALNPTYIQA